MICKRCEIDNPYTEEYFYKTSNKKYSLQKICIECCLKGIREKRQKDNTSFIESSRKYYQNHKKEHSEWNKKYYEKHKKQINNLHIYNSRRRKSIDLNFKIREYYRSRIYRALKQNWKSGHTLELLGCSVDFLKQWLETKFQLGMTWENYGKWHIDHIIPCCKFDLSRIDEQKKCFHYTNLQPLWAEDNWKKKIIIGEQ
jgi:hypothetical protein